MNIIYAGSPEASKNTLEILYNAQKDCDFNIVGVISNPPAAKGRHKELTPTPVAAFAQEKGIPVFTPEHLDAECRSQIEPLHADLLVCFAYGHIFGPKFLSMFKFGGLNLHPSDLPKFRGCTPVQATILAGEPFVTVSIQTLSLRMDEGDIVASDFAQIDDESNAVDLLRWASIKGAELISKIIKKTNETGKIEGKPQTGVPSYTGIITKADAKIDWQNDDVGFIVRKVRAYYDNPCSWCFENNQPLKIYEAEAITDEMIANSHSAVLDSIVSLPEFGPAEFGTVFLGLFSPKDNFILVKAKGGLLKIKKLQRQGKNIMTYKEFLNGARNFSGTVLK